MSGGGRHGLDLPAALPLLEGPGSLARAGAATSRAFSIGGRRAAAWGTELRGVREVRSGAWILLRALESGCGPASSALVGPHSVLRETLCGEGSAIETFFLPLDGAAAALQWRRPQGVPLPLATTLRWTVSREGAELLSAFPQGDLLQVVEAGAEGADAACALYLVRPEPTSWRIEAGEGDLAVAVDVGAAPGEPLTLLSACGPSPAAAAAELRRLARLRAQEVAVEQALEEARRDGLATSTGVAELDDALQWARLRARGAVAPREQGRAGIRRGGLGCGAGEASGSGDDDAPGTSRRPRPSPRGDASVSSREARSQARPSSHPLGPEAEEAWVALGALAGGDREAADVLLEGDFPTPCHLLAAGRHVAWLGEPAVLLPHRERLARAVERTLDASLQEDAGASAAAGQVVALAALGALAEAWEALGEDARAGALRARAVRLREVVGRILSPMASTPALKGGPRRLPVLGGGARPSVGHEEALLLAALLDVGGAGPYRPPREPSPSGMDRALRAWATCAAGDPEEGYRLFREHTDSGFGAATGAWASEQARGEGEGGAPAGCFDHAAAAALIPAILFHGLLGGRADAPAGRLRIAPRLPSAWRAFRTSGIRSGDASVSLDYARRGREHDFRARQERGAVPLMLVLEPEVAEAALAMVLVDGVEASLDRFRRGTRSGVRVQLPLDRERTLTLVGTPP